MKVLQVQGLNVLCINNELFHSIQELRHNRVKTWTRHVNIFEKDFVFVPINQR